MFTIYVSVYKHAAPFYSSNLRGECGLYTVNDGTLYMCKLLLSNQIWVTTQQALNVNNILKILIKMKENMI